MSRIGFLRRQAETCLRLAETCSDKTTAEYLRLMAAEFFKRAVEAENDWLHASGPEDASPVRGTP